jgi:hypothetical protein
MLVIFFPTTGASEEYSVRKTILKVAVNRYHGPHIAVLKKEKPVNWRVDGWVINHFFSCFELTKNHSESETEPAGATA